MRGTVRNPMPRGEVVDKARDLIAPVLGTATTQKLIDALLAIETVKDIRKAVHPSSFQLRSEWSYPGVPSQCPARELCDESLRRDTSAQAHQPIDARPARHPPRAL